MAAVVKPEFGYLDPNRPDKSKGAANSPYHINFGDPNTNAGSSDNLTSGYARAYDALQPLAPKIDPRYKAVQDLQRQSAGQFRSNIKNTEDSLYAPVAGDTKRQLASALHNVKANSNSRGLLFGGSRMGAEGAARGAAASDLASQRSGINKSVEDTADALDTGAIGTGFGMAGLNTGQAGYDLNQAALNQQQALSQMQANQTMLGGLGSGLGSAVGGYLGYKKPAPRDDT